jgi:hypothetical protein
LYLTSAKTFILNAIINYLKDHTSSYAAHPLAAYAAFVGFSIVVLDVAADTISILAIDWLTPEEACLPAGVMIRPLLRYYVLSFVAPGIRFLSAP